MRSKGVPWFDLACQAAAQVHNVMVSFWPVLPPPGGLSRGAHVGGLLDRIGLPYAAAVINGLC